MNIPRPTAEQCSKKTKIYESEDAVGYAMWYPQMGGYIGMAVALFDKSWVDHSSGAREGGCIDVLVWHDGEFPFADEDQNPKELHHCNPEQFIKFGKTLLEINERGRKKV